MSLDKLVDSTKLDAALTYEANKIRSKTGSSAQLTFDLENNKGFGDLIDTIVSKGGEYDIVQTVDGNNCTLAVTDANTVSLETKSVTVTSNGATTISPSTGYDGISSVSLTTNVPVPVNVKKWIVTESAAVLVSGDSDVAAHYLDASAKLYLMLKTNPNVNASVTSYAMMANSVMWIDSSTDYYGRITNQNFYTRSGGGGSTMKTDMHTNPAFFVNSSGDIRINTSSVVIATGGTYELIFTW